MDKIKKCQICGRIDFKTEGIYMVCRACGEKRPAYPFPLKYFLLVLTFLLGGITSTVLGFKIAFSYPTGSSGPQRPWQGVLTDGAFDAGNTNGFDFFMRGIEDYLIILQPFIWVSAIVFYILMIICARTFFAKLKNKQQAEYEILRDYK